MNKNNAKDYLPFVQAMADEKIVEYKDSCGQWISASDLDFCLKPENYRIVEPKKLVRYDFSDAEKLRGIWIKYKDKEVEYNGLIISINEDGVLTGNKFYSYKTLFEKLETIDNKPLGKEV